MMIEFNIHLLLLISLLDNIFCYFLFIFQKEYICSDQVTLVTEQWSSACTLLHGDRPNCVCYESQAVSLIASYLNVPLRYPLRFGGSRSYVLDPAPSVEPSSITSVGTSVPPSTSMRTTEFPLFLDSQETTRSSYAIFLLNKVGLLAMWIFIYYFNVK